MYKKKRKVVIKMKKNELLEGVVEMGNSGESLQVGESCRYNKDYLDDKELRTLLHSKFEKYEVYSDPSDYNYIVIERVKE